MITTRSNFKKNLQMCWVFQNIYSWNINFSFYAVLLPILKKILRYLHSPIPFKSQWLRTTRLNNREKYIRSPKFLCFKWISVSALIISLHTISWMVFIPEREDERQELNLKYCLLSLSKQGLKWTLDTFHWLRKNGNFNKMWT